MFEHVHEEGLGRALILEDDVVLHPSANLTLLLEAMRQVFPPFFSFFTRCVVAVFRVRAIYWSAAVSREDRTCRRYWQLLAVTSSSLAGTNNSSLVQGVTASTG